MCRVLVRLVISVSILGARPAAAQMPPPQPSTHEHMDMGADGWQFSHEGVVFGMFNHQGGPRGGDEATAPNWWMGMLTRTLGSSQLTFNGMFSLDPATAGKRGYREIFQVGEAIGGRPLIDRQHPHDFFMQLAAIWRTPITSATGLTIAGGPVGEPALGPVAFMHRASASEYPFATLSHHIFDSTHIAFGVVTAAIDRGPWVVEASVFNGREPDENRWDFDFGALDSISGRVWYRPTDRWELQASTGHLKHPEELEPGNVQRTTASASWFMREADDFSALTIGYGVNATDEVDRHAVFAEGTRRVGPTSIFGRFEVLQVETNVLVNEVPSGHDDGDRRNTLGAFTFGGVRDVTRWHGLDAGLGASMSLYAVPDGLKITHGAHPVSFQVFVRVRSAAGSMGRMWNMRMSQPMAGHR
jgi:hypothetical protein